MKNKIIHPNHQMIRQLTTQKAEFDSSEDCCGTSYAAKLLGLSIGTIQGLVEKNELQGWRTQGGHRRISMQSINSYLKKYNIYQEQTSSSPLRVLIVEDDKITRDMLTGHCERADLSIDCTAMSSSMEALIDISSLQPDLLITDLDMPGINGFELLRILRNNPHFDNMMIVVLSAMSIQEIQELGQLPTDSIVMTKPVKAGWFDGLFAGIKLIKKPKVSKPTKEKHQTS